MNVCTYRCLDYRIRRLGARAGLSIGGLVLSQLCAWTWVESNERRRLDKKATECHKIEKVTLIHVEIDMNYILRLYFMRCS
jgi:hypothetical protein